MSERVELPDDVKDAPCGCGEPSGSHAVRLHVEVIRMFERAAER